MSSSFVSMKKLSLAYGETVVVPNLDLDIREGELIAFLGPSGCGKTTTMRAIFGLVRPDAGGVRWKGQPVARTDRLRFGYMPEERGLYPKMKVGEQLVFLARLHGMSIRAAQESVDRWTTRLGVDQRVNDDVGDLSLGNQQRVQLAAALVHDPRVLVLDEPFSGLDPVAVDVMSDVLKEKAAEGIPVIFSSHQLDLVQRLCDRVGIVARGQMRALGRVDELRARDGVTLEITGPTTTTRWADDLPGVLGADYRHTDNITSLRVDPTIADDQSILAAALRTGPVHRFAPSTPDLTELFREAVSA